MFDRIKSGIDELDLVTQGGLIKGNINLIKGTPGTGKTTFGLHFLQEGVSNREKVLFVSFSIEESKLKVLFSQLGFLLDEMHILDLSPNSNYFEKKKIYDVFSPEEVEKEPILDLIREKIEELQPSRIVIDDITQFRYLIKDPFKYRMVILSLMNYLNNKKVTTVFTIEEETAETGIEYIVDSIFALEREQNYLYLQIEKFRGSNFIRTKHLYELTAEGVKLYPTIEKYPKELFHIKKLDLEILSTGIPIIDEILYGGFNIPSHIVISGSSGTGKTIVASSFTRSFSSIGIKSLMLLLEEKKEHFTRRIEGINIPAGEMVKKKMLFLKEIDADKEHFSKIVHETIKELVINQINVLIIDSVSSLEKTIKTSNTFQELSRFFRILKELGVITISAYEQKSITGNLEEIAAGVSQFFDCVMVLRYIEIKGSLKRVMGVIKKRDSDFDKYLREFQITKYGIKIGESLHNLRGILTGIPELIEEKEGEK